MARRGNRRTGGISQIGGVVSLTALVITALVFVATGQRTGAIAGVTSDMSGAIGRVITAPVRWGQQGVASVDAFLGGAKLNAKLKAENESLLQWRSQVRAMSERLDSYEKLLGMTKEPLPRGLAGRLVGESNDSFSRVAIVNVGAKDGVQVNWIVLNPNGLVGRVIAVGQTSSRILLLGDGESRVPVMGEVTRARAIASGDKSTAPRLAHLNTPALMQDGERLMTSGDDGIFPRGIAVGQAGIAPDKQWRVRLATSAGPVDFVRLVPPSNFPAPMDSVTPPALDAPPQGTAPNLIGPTPGAAQGILPLAPGAAPVPSAATPEAIRAAQMEIARKTVQQNEESQKLAKKLLAERDAARELARKAEAARIAAEQRAARANRPTQSGEPRVRVERGNVKTKEKLDPNAVPVAPAAAKAARESVPVSPPPTKQEGQEQ
jgi:rod shape-determining protein MreC